MRLFDVVLLLLAFRPQGWRPPGGPQGPGHGPPGPSGHLNLWRCFKMMMMDLEFMIINPLEIIIRNWFALVC